MNKIIIIILVFLCFSCDLRNKDTKLTFLKIGNYSNYPSDGGSAKQDIIKSFSYKANISDYNVELISQDRYKLLLEQKLLLNDAPMAFQIYHDQINELTRSKSLLNLTPYLKYMPNYMSQVKETDLASYTINNKVYALPPLSFDGLINGKNTEGLAIRKDWLKNLNLTIPKTIYELENVLKEFTQNDPDKNGENDTIGISLDENFNLLWGAYGIPYSNAKSSWININGSIKNMTTLPEAKEIILLLQKWYSKGYINFDRRNNSGMNVLKSNKVGISLISVWSIANVEKDLKSKDPLAYLEMLPAIAGPNGDKGYPVNLVPQNALGINSTIKKSKLMDMIKFLDWSVDNKSSGGFMKMTYGLEGVHYSTDSANDTIKVIDYNKAISDGYSNPIRFIPITDRRWISPCHLRDNLKILNNPDNITYYTSPYIKTNTSYFTDYLWPKISIGVITGELTIEEWNIYANNFQSLTLDTFTRLNYPSE